MAISNIFVANLLVSLKVRNFEDRWAKLLQDCSGIKITIHSGFSGTVLIFNVCRNKNHSSLGVLICPVFGLVSDLSPRLTNCVSIRLHMICSHMLTHRWPKISSDFICIMYIRKNRWQPQTPLEELMMLPQTLRLDHRQLANVAFTPYDSCHWRLSWIAVPKLRSP